MDFTVVELFAGVAGFGLAIERSGGKVLVQVEKDKNCLSVLEKHFPNVERIIKRMIGVDKKYAK